MSLVGLLLLALFASCTAINQKDAYLDALPRPNVPIFEDNFESGLTKWNQTSGSWTTTTGSGATGAYLQSPATTAATTFSIRTSEIIDLSNQSNCLLEYWVRFDITGNTSTSMRFDFAGSTVTAIKETGTLIAVNSSLAFVKRRVRLPTGISGYLNLITTTGTTTTVDVRIDSLRVSCNQTFGSPVTIMSENFDSGGANWASGFWSVQAGIGPDGSSGYQCQNNNGNGSRFANYIPNIDLTGRSACKLRYYYQGSLLGNSGNSFTSRWNGSALQSFTIAGGGGATHSLAAFEGTSANILGLENFEGGSTTNNITNVDNVVITCEE